MSDSIENLTFAVEVGGPMPPDLARASLLLAREIDYPGLRITPYLSQLDAWADTARSHMPKADSALARATRLAEFLFREIGLRGNQDDYYDPRNSYLNEVIERKVGLPISLSAIYIEVGARLGLHAEGIGLPGHFVIAVSEAGERFYLDPFHGGRILQFDGLSALVADHAGQGTSLPQKWLRAQRTSDILARMLHNLRSVYVEREDWRRAAAVVEHLIMLQSLRGSNWRDLGLLLVRLGERRRGVEHLEHYLRLEPDAADNGAVREVVDGLSRQLARLN